MKEEKIEFKAEVAKVLDIVIHSLYSHKEIFLRELISNAADACDKLRYTLLLHPELSKDSASAQITLTPDKKAKTLTISDTGIGMNKDDLINHLGTIARSGSADFLKTLTGDKQKDMSLIGQFGVGFYASFMVADTVVVQSKKIGETAGWMWRSTGAGSFTITQDDSVPTGTSIILHMKKDDLEFLDPIRLRHLVRQYSDYISLPIVLKDGDKSETINEASALWTRPKSDITETQYKDFYQSISHAFDAPWMTLHYRAEGVIDYTALLFIPKKPPFNLFQPDRKSGLSLYVNRVFISNDIPELLPPWLRFASGVIDTKDLPLNVSREMLQNTPVMSKIKSGLTKRILGELKKQTEDLNKYTSFWNNFGIVLKEGLYEPSEYRTDVANLSRFYSTNGPELTSLSDYIKRMKKGQENIYYITGSNLDVMRQNPQLEGFSARGIEVLLLTDPVDEFWTQTMPDFDGKKFLSVTHAGKDFEKIKQTETPQREAISAEMSSALCTRIKEILEGEITDVKTTDRLTKSPVALVAGEGQMSLHLERMMKAHGQATNFASSRILEINPRHPLIHKMANMLSDKAPELTDIIWLLYDQTLIIEGEPIKNPARFTERFNEMVLKNFG